MKAMEEDDSIVLLLGDIGVFAFDEAMKRWPKRVLNVGVMEQAMVSLAAGLAKDGLFPIVHTIAPFMVERALEQIKLDFGYNGLPGLFVSVGASYDYAGLGCTHHCPADVGIMRLIPHMKVMVPGHPDEAGEAIFGAVTRKCLTYVRLAEKSHPYATLPSGPGAQYKFGHGMDATVVCVGHTLDLAMRAAKDLHVTVRYVNDISRGADVFPDRSHSPKYLTIEPYYHGAVADEITAMSWPRLVSIKRLGVPHRFLRNFGSHDQHDVALGFSYGHIRRTLAEVIES